jgi:hypothetical protein
MRPPSDHHQPVESVELLSRYAREKCNSSQNSRVGRFQTRHWSSELGAVGVQNWKHGSSPNSILHNRLCFVVPQKFDFKPPTNSILPTVWRSRNMCYLCATEAILRYGAVDNRVLKKRKKTKEEEKKKNEKKRKKKRWKMRSGLFDQNLTHLRSSLEISCQIRNDSIES